MMLGTPLLIGLSLVALGMADHLPGLYIAMILQAAAPPVISAPTLAALMGLDAALSLATLVVCTAATPLTAPVFAALFAGRHGAVAGRARRQAARDAGRRRARRRAGAPRRSASPGSRRRRSASTA